MQSYATGPTAQRENGKLYHSRSWCRSFSFLSLFQDHRVTQLSITYYGSIAREACQQAASLGASIMPNRPVRDLWEYLRKRERHFPIKLGQPIGMALTIFYSFSEFLARAMEGRKIFLPVPSSILTIFTDILMERGIRLAFSLRLLPWIRLLATI